MKYLILIALLAACTNDVCDCDDDSLPTVYPTSSCIGTTPYRCECDRYDRRGEWYASSIERVTTSTFQCADERAENQYGEVDDLEWMSCTCEVDTARP